MIKSYKIRLYPTKKQEDIMWQHIGSCRYVWNWMLVKQQELYQAGEKYLPAFSMIRLLTPLKNDDSHSWLRNISSASLQRVCSDLDEAYKRFFNRQSGYPKLKSRKKSKPSYAIRSDTFYFIDDRYVQIEKLKKVKYKTDFVLPMGRKVKFKNIRISNTNGKWMLSFGLECENQARELTDISMGIDLGVKETMVVAYGSESVVFHNINKSKRVKNIQKQIRRLQRDISRKYEANRVGDKYVTTNNIIKTTNKLRRLYAKLVDIRTNYIHQCTHQLISMLPYRVVMEDLNVSGMMKNRHLSKAIQEQCFYEIVRQMKYKCEWNGIQFVQADRFYPSSKTCSCCGCVNDRLTLKDRTFVCPECGFTIDRDYQAALNLSRYGA